MENKSTGILRDIDLSTYDFRLDDIGIAALLRSYLNLMRKEDALEVLENIVSVGVRELPAQARPNKIRVSERLIPRELWTTLDGGRLAGLIDTARATAAISADEWQAQKGERLLKKTLDYVKEDLLVHLSGERYVASMPVEIAEFITDCYLYLKNN